MKTPKKKQGPGRTEEIEVKSEINSPLSVLRGRSLWLVYSRCRQLEIFSCCGCAKLLLSLIF